jgi:hypothetical protein
LSATNPTETPDSVLKKDSSSKKVSFDEIKISSGKGALTEGTYIDFSFSSEKSFAVVTISNNDIMVTNFFRLFEDKILVGPSAGYYRNTPWIGPQLVFSPTSFISTFHWVGWTVGEFGQDLSRLKDSKFAFAANQITLKHWRLELNYCLIHYLKNEPMHTSGIRYSQEINEKFKVYTDIGYNFTDEVQLLKLGIIWKQ